MSYTEPEESLRTKYKVIVCSNSELEEMLNKYSDTEWLLHTVVPYGMSHVNIVLYDITYF